MFAPVTPWHPIHLVFHLIGGNEGTGTPLPEQSAELVHLHLFRPRLLAQVFHALLDDGTDAGLAPLADEFTGEGALPIAQRKG